MKEDLPKNQKYMSRNRLDVMQKFLQHRQPIFHSPRFNLIVENLIMKEQVFQSTRMYCSMKHADGSSMADKYGAMTSKELQNAIQAAQQDHGSRHSTKPENRYLKSITATCEYLPHSNEAARNARRIYFSFLIQFGLPAIFLTITPDDKRNFRIVLYACKGRVLPFGSVDVNSFTDEEIIADFRIREQIREDHPGLCAEEYQRIVQLVIKHLFAWDEEEQCSTGKGLFGELLAWCLATEEQGRKTLHGHFLLFIKDWDELLNKLQSVGGEGFANARSKVKTFFDNACSAQLFSQFGPGQPLNEQAVFHHEQCRPSRASKHRRFTPQYVGDQAFCDMRHKAKCNEHRGRIANCNVCGKNFTVQGIIENALQFHLGGNGDETHSFNFPSRENQRLDAHVYEMQKDFDWMTADDTSRAKRYFASNALSNFHLPTHTNRCFKKGSECFTNLPEQPFEATKVMFDEEMHTWRDWSGMESHKGVFRLYPKRNLEDAFMNVHHELITTMLGFNNNVTAGLNGSSVFYCTGYNTKSQQAEERMAFESISRVILHHLEKQEQEQENVQDELCPSQLGFRRMLAGIYTHTNSYILAAPMAHYLALNHSRFHYSHDNENVPVHGLESILLGEGTVMTFRHQNGKQIAHHKAMDYLHRPIEFEDMTPITFFSQVERISSKKADNNDDDDIFQFEEGYPLNEIFLCRRRDRDVVPVFPWNWLSNTRKLKGTLVDNPSVPDTYNFNSREAHARRFLILFSTFRDKEDLISAGSYQETLRIKLATQTIDDTMIKTADRIQNIYNSLDSGQCENILNGNTFPPDADDIEEQEEGELDSFDEMLANVGAYMASTSGGPLLTEEATDLTPNFVDSRNTPSLTPTGDDYTPLEDIFQPNTEILSDTAQAKEPNTYRFKAKTSELNTFFISSFCQLNPDYDASMELDEAIKTKPPKYIVKPNGSMESIVAWARNAKLDTEQEIAFQILAATYVLTFLEEAEDDCNQNQKESLLKRKKQLQILARKKEGESRPVRLFVTGPAGAGKCESTSMMYVYVLSAIYVIL